MYFENVEILTPILSSSTSEIVGGLCNFVTEIYVRKVEQQFEFKVLTINFLSTFFTH